MLVTPSGIIVLLVPNTNSFVEVLMTALQSLRESNTALPSATEIFSRLVHFLNILNTDNQHFTS